MGIPGFYKWLKERYPKVLVDAIEKEEEPTVIDDDGMNSVPVVDSTNLEFDNLYLDLNGIIPPCLQPEDKPVPETLDDVFQNMFDYIDRLFLIVRPRKLLYIALDGVAPIAKMNQQRARRFRSAKDSAEEAVEKERLRQEFEKEGKKLPPKQRARRFRSSKDSAEAAVEKERLRQEFEKEGKKLPPKHDFSALVFTVGSKFIDRMISQLLYYIHLRLNNDPGWSSIKVVLSDAYVPGEAEHKIMAYIRLQRNLPGYDPNTRHCMYGLDADLIMLALTSHEVHFSILRESGHFAANCDGKVKEKSEESDKKCESATVGKLLYEFLNIWTLREYLEYEMRIPNPPFEIDFECIMDDFIFMCFFIGNDFLPSMPTLDTREGAINLLIAVYRKEFTSMGGYLTDSGKPILSRVEHFIQKVGSYEDEIFQKRARLYQRWAERVRREKAQARIGDDANLQFEPKLSVRTENEVGQTMAGLSVLDIERKQSGSSKGKEIDKSAEEVSACSSGGTVSAAIVEAENDLEIEIDKNEDELLTKLCELLQDKSDPFNPVNLEKDKVKLGELGWKERYYRENFSAKTPDELETIRKDVVLRYTEGLCWLMDYYYEGVCSWQWFYPYHYAPFASDLQNLSQFKISFELGVPLKPFDQLMGVLPPASSRALPKQYRKLMTDPNSPIIDFYPTDFEVDTSGKWYNNQGIPKLPFIDEGRLLAETKKVKHTLTEDELQRNIVWFDMLFVTQSHPLSPYIHSLYNHDNQFLEKESDEVKKRHRLQRLDPKASDGMNGYLVLHNGDTGPPIIISPEMETNNQVLCAIYRLPDAHKHVTRPPTRVIFPKKTVTEGDLKPPPALWHEDTWKKPWGKGRQNSFQANPRRQLGEAARQLIVNSMQIEKEDIGMDQKSEPSSAAAATCNAPTTPSNVGNHVHEHLRLAPHGGRGYHGHNNGRHPNASSSSSSTQQHSYEESSSHSRYGRNNLPTDRWTDNPTRNDGYRPGSRQSSGGSHYPYRNSGAQTPRTATGGAQDHPGGGGYSDYIRDQRHQAYRASDHYQTEGSSVPATSQRGLGRGFGNTKQFDDRNLRFR